MSYFRFNPDDKINTSIKTHPSFTVELNGDQMTGSVYLEKQFLNSDLENRLFEGDSTREGGKILKTSPFTASVDIVDAEEGATNSQLYRSILNLYNHYSLINTDYTASFTGSETTRFRVITIPEIYYDRAILSGTFSASDDDNAGDARELFDNGRGGIYSGSLTGTLVGNIFYNEGLVVLKGAGLNDEANSNDFGESSATNFKWKTSFKGTHTIPVKIFKCRAPAGQLNASTNSSFYQEPDEGDYKNEKEVVLTGSTTYITRVGLYNKNYELVGVAHLAQPIKKEESSDLMFRLRMDW